jgi:polyhydroxyalkanoate synthesis regulator phasin
LNIEECKKFREDFLEKAYFARMEKGQLTEKEKERIDKLKAL